MLYHNVCFIHNINDSFIIPLITDVGNLNYRLCFDMYITMCTLYFNKRFTLNLKQLRYYKTNSFSFRELNVKKFFIILYFILTKKS